MHSLNPVKAWRSFLALPNEVPLKTFGIAFLVALLCSIVVSLTSVGLKPLQQENRLRESASSMVKMVEGLGYGLPQKQYVERVSGDYVSRSSRSQSPLSEAQDLAGLSQVEDVVTVYEVHAENRLALVILPIRGVGYKSMIKGYLALDADLTTIKGLTFHQQDETPGMGARIMESDWLAKWTHKQAIAPDGTVHIKVVKGQAKSPNEVDGISGATRTGWGVTDMLRFWLGADGYGPYLERLKREAGS